MKKVLAIVLSVAMLLSVLSVNIFAEDDVLFDLSQYKSEIADYEAGKVAEGWCPSAITEWSGQQDTMAAFVEALRTEGAYIEVITKPNSDGGNVNGLLLMSYPLDDGDQYTSTIFSTKLADAYEIEDGKTVTTFDAAAAVAQYESTPHGDDDTGETMCSLDKLMNFGIDIPSGAIIYNVMVKVAPSTFAEKVSINKEEFFDTLVDAVAAAEDGDTIYLHEDMEGAGIGIFAPDVKDFTIDFGGNTYTCIGPAVGSSGTQSQAFHLEKSADTTPNVKLQNGTLTATTDSGVYMLIQNYCNLTLTDMKLIGTEDTQYVLSNNFGNTVIDGNTSITATPGNIAFDVCCANGTYADGVSVTLDTTGTITGDIELGVWNAAGGSNPAPDINDYLEKANLTINNVKLEGKIINKVGGTYEPDPETYESEAGLELFISTRDNQSAPAVFSVIGIPGPGECTISYNPGETITRYDWIMLKSKGSEGTSVAGSPIPAGTVIRTYKVEINNEVIPFPNEAEYVDYTVGENGKVEAQYYFVYGGGLLGSKPSETIDSIEITFELLENDKTQEEIEAEYNNKLQSAIDINGGVFAQDSNVDDYLPAGGYDTDNDGNIVVGDVQLPSVNMHDNNRITGCVYLNEDYHALIVNGRFIAQPHVDNGTGFCVACKGAINK